MLVGAQAPGGSRRRRRARRSPVSRPGTARPRRLGRGRSAAARRTSPATERDVRRRSTTARSSSTTDLPEGALGAARGCPGGRPLQPPYRAAATTPGRDVWAVAADGGDALFELPERRRWSELELSVGSARRATSDGRRRGELTGPAIEPLDSLDRATTVTSHSRAERVDGDAGSRSTCGRSDSHAGPSRARPYTPGDERRAPDHPARRSRRGREEHDRLRARRETIVVDTGLAFPRDEHLGVDLVLPDFTTSTTGRSSRDPHARARGSRRRAPVPAARARGRPRDRDAAHARC